MADREKVIKGLECCCEHIEGMNCDHCPYDEEQTEIGQINQCTSALSYDALELLKEQSNTMNKLRGTMEDMKDGIASEAVSYLLTLMDKWEGR